MRRPAVLLLLAIALAGCGGGKAAAPPAPATTAGTTTAAAPKPFTSVLDIAACNELETKIRIVSQLVSSSVEVMTQSVHPKQLAKRAGDTRDNLLYASHVLAQIVVPKSLVQAQQNLTAGLRQFAADFGRAQTSVRHNNIARAAQQLVDKPALAKVSEATGTIDRACRA
jgi:PBP1b-binding outer membrane lipoprotein LpoB